MVMFLQKVDNIINKSASSYQNFAAEVTKLGAGDEIRRFDGTPPCSVLPGSTVLSPQFRFRNTGE